MSAAKKTLARVEASKKGRWFVLRSLDGSDFAFRLFADGFQVNDEVVILPAPTGEQLALEERVKQLTETADHLRGQVEKLILAQPPVAMVERATKAVALLWLAAIKAGKCPVCAETMKVAVGEGSRILLHRAGCAAAEPMGEWLPAQDADRVLASDAVEMQMDRQPGPQVSR